MEITNITETRDPAAFYPIVETREKTWARAPTGSRELDRSIEACDLRRGGEGGIRGDLVNTN